jgi:hypothetical protein
MITGASSRSRASNEHDAFSASQFLESWCAGKKGDQKSEFLDRPQHRRGSAGAVFGSRVLAPLSRLGIVARAPSCVGHTLETSNREDSSTNTIHVFDIRSWVTSASSVSIALIASGRACRSHVANLRRARICRGEYSSSSLSRTTYTSGRRVSTRHWPLALTGQRPRTEPSGDWCIASC